MIDWVKENPEDLVSYDKYKKAIEMYKFDSYKQIKRNVKCYWLYGATGKGKTHRGYQLCGINDPDVEELHTVFKKEGKDDWWDGYEGQAGVIFDEIPKIRNKELLDEIKTIGDKWPKTLNVKGSRKHALYTVLVVTC